ncbi:MAG TPA: DedA family protein [Burkholderiales bacterium]|nr:DedA family protein [Burkholderiales bacterium]
MDLTELIGPEASLWSLAFAAFLAATLLPMSSEAALFGVLKQHPDLFWPALAVATVANTLGGMTSYLVGRFLATRKPLKHVETVERWGPAALLLAWTPLVGDALCVAAGWLRLNWMSSTALQAAGRFARYWVVAQGAGL